MAWPGSELTVVEDAGHGDDTVTATVIAATDRFARG